MGSASRASFAPPAPATAPVLETCTFIPNPRLNTSYDCVDEFAPAAFADVSIAFQVNVSDATDNNMSVTFYFDYWSTSGVVNPASPVRTINVTSPGGALPVSANTTWTYAVPNANFTGGQYFVYVNVTNDANESSGSGELLFVIYVTYNSPPSIGISSINPVSEPIRPVNPVVPLVYENVTVHDPDSDPVTMTWEWGDGTRTVNTTGPLVDVLDVSVTHRYPLSLFPLNETPRFVDILVRVWIDDGMGNNVSANSTTEFYLDYDAPPAVRVDRPAVGSVWKVGEPVRMEGNVTDREGDPTTSYWDFDNRTDSTGIGDPTRNRDANGTVATHAYALPGVYNITLWSTDGEKLLCLDSTCANFTTHWTKAVVPIEVRYNLPPVLALENASTVAGQPILLRVAVYDGDGDSMTVRWDFGDGTPDAINVTDGSPRTAPLVLQVYQEHNYTEPGNWTLTVDVSDGNDTMNDARTVFVRSFNLPPVLLQILVYRANGTLATENRFPANATVVVKASLYDRNNDTLEVSVDWADGSMVNLTTIDPRTASGCSLDNLNRNVCNMTFSHVYTDIGADQLRNYTVLVTVSDRIGTTASSPVTIQVYPAATVTLTATRRAAAPGTPLSFSASSSGGSGSRSFSWGFGDATNGTGPSVAHTYTSPGTFTVTVTVCDSVGGTASYSVSVTIAWLVVMGAVSATSAMTGANVTFMAWGSGGDGGPYTYSWSFGDGSTGAGASAVHTFANPGSYTPKVTATDASGAKNTTTLARITIESANPPPSGADLTVLVAIVVVALASVGAAVWVTRRRRRRAGRPPAEPPTPPAVPPPPL